MAREIESGRAKPIAITGDDGLVSLLKRIANAMGASATQPAPTPDDEILVGRSEPAVILSISADTALSVYLNAIAAVLESGGGGGDITGLGVAGRIPVWTSISNIGSDAELTYNSETDTLATLELETDHIDFDISPSATGQEGRLFWSADDGTLQVGMPGGNVNLQIGQEELIRAYNDSGADIPNGRVVMINGSHSSRPTIILADATTNQRVSGITTEDIDDHHYGYITTSGLVRDLNTIAWAAGTKLYLSTTPGLLTSTPPSAPNVHTCIAMVLYQHAVNGIILFKPQPGIGITDLNNVNGGAPSDFNVLKWNNTSGYYEPISISSLVNQSGRIRRAYHETSIDVTLDETHSIVRAVAPCTITLPTAVGISGAEYKISSDTNIIVIGTGGETIDGDAAIPLLPGETIDVYSDGANWQV